MTGFIVKGWCPDAWRPMMAGDGLLVRAHPPQGRLTRDQAIGLCELALLHGNGAIDVTSRANLQFRGISEPGWRALLDRLIAIGLVDPDPIRESRAIIVAPDWRDRDDTHRIAGDLRARLGDLPDLPGKVGFVIDAGPSPILTDTPGDFRIERGAAGGLILRAAGRATGAPVIRGEEADALIRLAHWFVDSGGAGAGRMARHDATLPGWATGDEPPAPPAARLAPGPHPLGLALGLPFGRTDAAALLRLFDREPIAAVRVTPWRILIAEGPVEDADDFIRDPASPLLRVDACVGAPACPQGTVDTRALARRLATHLDGRLHLSGCAKGCARAKAADITVTGRGGRYDLILDGRAGDAPTRASLDADQLLACFGAA